MSAADSPTMGPRVGFIAFVLLFLVSAASAAPPTLVLPGGAASLREATGLPASVPDHMLLSEVVRTWYGERDPVRTAEPPLRRLLDHVRSSREPLAPASVLPLGVETWLTLLGARDERQLAISLLSNRNAMLLYYGLIAVDPPTAQWFAAHPRLLADILEEGASAFASSAPWIRVRDGRLVLPGAGTLDAAWERVVEQPLSDPEAFVRSLVRRHRGRLAWLYSVLASLDRDRCAFAAGSAGAHLPDLARLASRVSPEWIVDERPFWRPAFDFSLVLAFVRLPLRGSDAFWQQVFRNDDLHKFQISREDAAPLKAPVLLDLLFEEPYLAHARWNVFTLGQTLPEVEGDAPLAGLALRGARRHPALARMLDRIQVTALPLLVSLHRVSARITQDDVDGTRGRLGAWQGALALIERAALTGGLDRPAAEAALGRLAALPLEDPRAEITAWLLGDLLPGLAARPGAPDGAEPLVLQTMSGALTPAGPRRFRAFAWEDLEYVLNAPQAVARRMAEARAAQGGPSLDQARTAWTIASGGDADPLRIAEELRVIEDLPGIAEAGRRLADAARDGDRAAVRRAARRAAESMVAAILPALAYVPHLAVTEVPELGADVAFRHLFAGLDDGPQGRDVRPWRVAEGQARTTAGWRLEGSLLLLDLALSQWHFRRHGDPPLAPPAFDELDVAAFGQVAAIARAQPASDLDTGAVARAIERGRARVLGATDLVALDGELEAAGIDPWRRASIRLGATSVEDAASSLTLAEHWRLGGAPGNFAAQVSVDGRVRLGEVPRANALLGGRRSTGLIGSASVDAQVRTAAFLHAKRLPAELFGEVVAGILGDVIDHAVALRPDDFAAPAWCVARIDDSRMEEHVLALVADDSLARPSMR